MPKFSITIETRFLADPGLTENVFDLSQAEQDEINYPTCVDHIDMCGHEWFNNFFEILKGGRLPHAVPKVDVCHESFETGLVKLQNLTNLSGIGRN